MSISLIAEGLALALGLIAIAGLAAPVRFKARATFSDRKLDYDVELRFLLIRFHLKSLLSKRKRAPAAQDLDKRSRSRPTEPDESGRSQDILERARSAISSIGMIKSFGASLRRLASSIGIEDFHFKGAVGTGDAAETAILVGLLTSLFGIALSLARRNGISFARRPRIAVRPIFDRAWASFLMEISVKVIPWKALLAGLSIYRDLRSGGVLKRRTATDSRPSQASRSSGDQRSWNAARWNTRA